VFNPGRFLRCKKISTSLGEFKVIEFTYTRGLIFESLDETSQISFACTDLKYKEHLLSEEDKRLIFEACREVNKPIPLKVKETGEDMPFYFCTLILCDKFHKDPQEIEGKYSRQQIIEWSHGISELNKWLYKDSEKEDYTPSAEEIEGNSFFQEMKEKYAMKGGEKV
jgi:hypothetical protein